MNAPQKQYDRQNRRKILQLAHGRIHRFPMGFKQSFVKHAHNRHRLRRRNLKIKKSRPSSHPVLRQFPTTQWIDPLLKQRKRIQIHLLLQQPEIIYQRPFQSKMSQNYRPSR